MNTIKTIIKFLLNLCGVTDKQTIWIDGGLGSQIISYMNFLQKSKENKNINCDVSFFLKSVDDNDFKEKLTYRSWKLDYFDIDLLSFKNQKSNFRLRPNTKIQGEIMEEFFSKFEKNDSWQDLFPIRVETTDLINSKYDVSNSKYTAIHVRKGDFLKFASLNIHNSEMFKILLSLKNIFNKKIFLVSDSPFDEYYMNTIYEIFDNHIVEFINGGDELEIHALLRGADILITSNSMYSLSAALLQKKEGLAIMPKHFYGKEFFSHNKSIQSLSNWMIFSN